MRTILLLCWRSVQSSGLCTKNAHVRVHLRAPGTYRADQKYQKHQKHVPGHILVAFWKKHENARVRARDSRWFTHPVIFRWPSLSCLHKPKSPTFSTCKKPRQHKLQRHPLQHKLRQRQTSMHAMSLLCQGRSFVSLRTSARPSCDDNPPSLCE